MYNKSLETSCKSSSIKSIQRWDKLQINNLLIEFRSHEKYQYVSYTIQLVMQYSQRNER